MPAGRVARALAGVLGLAALTLLAACSGPEKAQPAALPKSLPLVNARLVWRSEVGTVDFPLELRVVGNQILVAGSDGTVAAIDLDHGTDVWRTKLDSPLSAGVGSDGRYAAVVSRNNELIVLDAGHEVWRQRLTASSRTAPLVAGGRVFTLTGDRTVQAFDLASGRPLWQQAQRGADALVLGQGGLLIAVRDTLVAGIGGRVTGLDPLSGVTRWESTVASSRGTNEVERLSDVVAGYSRVGDQICVRAYQYAVACVDAASGQLAWTKPAVGSTGISGDASTLFGTELDGRVVAWKRSDGERLWTSSSLRYRNLSAPLLTGHSVVLGDNEGNLLFLARDDASLLNRLLTDGSPITVAPVIGPKLTLVAVTRQGGVFAYRPE